MAVADPSALNELFVQINSRVFMKDDGNEGCFSPQLVRKLMFQPCLAFLQKNLGHMHYDLQTPGSVNFRDWRKRYKKLRANQEVFVFRVCFSFPVKISRDTIF